MQRGVDTELLEYYNATMEKYDFKWMFNLIIATYSKTKKSAKYYTKI